MRHNTRAIRGERATAGQGGFTRGARRRANAQPRARAAIMLFCYVIVEDTRDNDAVAHAQQNAFTRVFKTRCGHISRAFVLRTRVPHSMPPPRQRRSFRLQNERRQGVVYVTNLHAAARHHLPPVKISNVWQRHSVSLYGIYRPPPSQDGINKEYAREQLEDVVVVVVGNIPTGTVCPNNVQEEAMSNKPPPPPHHIPCLPKLGREVGKLG